MKYICIYVAFQAQVVRALHPSIVSFPSLLLFSSSSKLSNKLLKVVVQGYLICLSV